MPYKVITEVITVFVKMAERDEERFYADADFSEPEFPVSLSLAFLHY